jgi:hypothetical protein
MNRRRQVLNIEATKTYVALTLPLATFDDFKSLFAEVGFDLRNQNSTITVREVGRQIIFIAILAIVIEINIEMLLIIFVRNRLPAASSDYTPILKAVSRAEW